MEKERTRPPFDLAASSVLMAPRMKTVRRDERFARSLSNSKMANMCT